MIDAIYISSRDLIDTSPILVAAPDAIASGDKLSFLKRPASYPDDPRSVRCIETHYAWVFLSRHFAYKLKKMVRTEWFDFTTASARHADACDEVALNRRLAPAVYLGVVPLSVDFDDGLRLEGPGTAVDWLVKMRLLPREQMLDHRLRSGRVTPEQIAPLAEMLATFWARQPGEPAVAVVEQAKAEITTSVQQLRTIGAFETADPTETAALLKGYLVRHAAQFERRLREQRVKELHGDLRPEHACLTTTPAVIDCLQFSRALRTLDVADELAFLSLECERLGAEWIESVLLSHYLDVSGDRPPATLLSFYKAYRALVRARFAAQHLRDCPIARRHHWMATTYEYLRYARKYATAATCAES